MNQATNKTWVYKVDFFEPIGGKTEYFFGSLKALFAEFSPEEVGISLSRAYSSNIDENNPRITKKCIIKRVSVKRIKRNKKQD